MVNINIELPDEIYKQGKKKAIDLGIGFYDYVIKAIEEKNKGGKMK